MPRKTVMILAFALLSLFVSMPAQLGAVSPTAQAPVQPGPPGGLPSVVPVCPEPAPPDAALCHALQRTDVSGLPNGGGPGASASTTPAGYGPSDLQTAYSLSVTGGSGQTVAIVDAYDDPNAASDLANYRNNFGLPTCSSPPVSGCTFTNGAKFTKVNQTGGTTSYPRGNTGWAEEISLDLDMVSAICPNCNILLVEAKSNRFSDLGTAENEAASLGANVISNSWGGKEFSSEGSLTYDGPFNHPGIAITVSAGDKSGVEFPAASQYVTAVGGTSLAKSASSCSSSSACRSLGGSFWSETVWNNFSGTTGGGCSAYITKPSWQTDTGCSRRTDNDVSADADPSTGVAVYDSYGEAGWLEFGGTSVASPIVASVYALAGNASSVNYGSFPYPPNTLRSSFFDVTSGTTGCTGGEAAYLCTAETGYDAPTGWGTPNTAGGF